MLSYLMLIISICVVSCLVFVSCCLVLSCLVLVLFDLILSCGCLFVWSCLVMSGGCLLLTQMRYYHGSTVVPVVVPVFLSFTTVGCLRTFLYELKGKVGT